jgi:hypothetical protein
LGNGRDPAVCDVRQRILIPLGMAVFVLFRSTDFYETSTKTGKICESLLHIPTLSGSQKFPFNFKDYQALVAAPCSMKVKQTGVLSEEFEAEALVSRSGFFFES